jgi:adenylate kinase
LVACAPGKGTFASRLAPLFGIPTISTGDLIRAEIKAGSAVGQQVKALTETGGLVSDEVVLGLLRTRLAQPDASKGFIIDGYPRRVSQAETLATLAPLGLAVNLVLDEKILIEKALARRVCQHCGQGYNLANIVRDGYFMPPLLPRTPGLCDRCPPAVGKLTTRKDDVESIIRDRLQIYQRETFPILDFYRQQGILLEFEVRKGVQDLDELKDKIETRLKTITQ